MKKIGFFLLIWLFFSPVFAQQNTGLDINNLYNCMQRVPSYFWHTTTDDIGNTYMGLYTQGDETERCAYIFKRNAAGKLSVVYYDEARHIHTVAFNPVTKKLYASQGDDIPWKPETLGQAKFIVSDDYGETWKTLQHYPRANYIPIVFDQKWCVIVWEDSAQYTPSSRLLRTCDDVRFETLLTLSGNEQWNRWSWYQTWTTIYMGTVVDGTWYVPTVWRSIDDGDTREQSSRLMESTRPWYGFRDIGLDSKWRIRYYFGNIQAQYSAFSSLTTTWNTK